MKLKIISYNIKFHRAYSELPQMVKSTKADLLCLQECDIRAVQDKVAQLSLATTARVGTMGLATYVNIKKFHVNSSQQIPLPSVWYEHINVQPRFRLQCLEIKHTKSKEKFILANLHLANLLASNYGRRRQAQELFKYVDTFRRASPAVIVGDFNYPLFARSLFEIAQANNFYELGKKHTKHTHNNPFIKGKFDRIFASKGVRQLKLKVMPFSASDHTPVYIEIEL